MYSAASTCSHSSPSAWPVGKPEVEPPHPAATWDCANRSAAERDCPGPGGCSSLGYSIAKRKVRWANSNADRSGVGKVKCRPAWALRPRQTTGSFESFRVAYRPPKRLPSWRVMLIEFAHARHFFPPRLEVVVEQENPNRFPARLRDQFAFHRFLGHQLHGPSGASFPRVAAMRCLWLSSARAPKRGEQCGPAECRRRWHPASFIIRSAFAADRSATCPKMSRGPKEISQR